MRFPMRSEDLKSMPVLSVGELIAKVEACGEKDTSGDDKTVRFDFEYLLSFHSLQPTRV
jgi:hypothetical protein